MKTFDVNVGDFVMVVENGEDKDNYSFRVIKITKIVDDIVFYNNDEYYINDIRKIILQNNQKCDIDNPYCWFNNTEI